MNISEILKQSTRKLMNLSRSELAKITSSLASAANKRLKRIEKAGLSENSPAYRYVERSGGKFSVAGKSTNELILEFKRAKQFLSDETKTSTLKGTRDYVKQQEQIVHERLGEFKSKQEARNFWNAYNKYQNTHKADVYNLGSDEVQRAIKQRLDSGKSLNASAITRQMNKLIEQQALLENELNEGEYNELANSDNEEFENPFL